MVNFVDWFGFNRADANKDGGYGFPLGVGR
jgi:hypothetical protein